MSYIMYLNHEYSHDNLLFEIMQKAAIVEKINVGRSQETAIFKRNNISYGRSISRR